MSDQTRKMMMRLLCEAQALQLEAEKLRRSGRWDSMFDAAELFMEAAQKYEAARSPQFATICLTREKACRLAYMKG